LIYRNVGDSEAYCDISVADDKARCLTLVVVCPGIQQLFLGEKCGKFSVVGIGAKKDAIALGSSMRASATAILIPPLMTIQLALCRA